jgi:hypothetical protein
VVKKSRQGRSSHLMMPTLTLTWGQIATLIAFVAIQGAFAYHVDKRFEDLRRYLEVRFKALEDRVEKLERHPVA